MKHLKLFEKNINKIYLVQDINTHNNTIETKEFAFYDIKSRDNFLVNYIHKMYSEEFDEYYEDIENTLDAHELLKEFNIEKHYIKLYTVEIQENVKLEPELQLRKEKLDYNL